eukprot:COSAG01_NODE_12462_length_1734_cov_16.568807_2_plen_66_part_00
MILDSKSELRSRIFGRKVRPTPPSQAKTGVTLYRDVPTITDLFRSRSIIVRGGFVMQALRCGLRV